MKKILSFLMAILLMSGIAFAAQPGNRTSPGIGDIMGNGGVPSDPHRIFRLVRCVPASGSADITTISANSIVIWDTTSADGVTVTTTTNSCDSRVAGVLVVSALTPESLGKTAAEAIGRRNWTWLQTYGLCTVDLSAETSVNTAGKAIGTSRSAYNAGEFCAADQTSSSYQGKAGFVVTAASTTGGSAVCFLTGLD